MTHDPVITEAMLKAGNHAFEMEMQRTGLVDDGDLVRNIYLAMHRANPVVDVEGMVERVQNWALDKAATHHRLAHENKHLRDEHIASSSAYRNLADELPAAIEALSSVKEAKDGD